MKTLVDEAAPERVILFGSHATGTPTEESDADLLVVQSEPFGAGRSRRLELARLTRALSGIRMPIDLLLYSTDEVEFWEQSPNHVVGRALREGRVMYERS